MKNSKFHSQKLKKKSSKISNSNVAPRKQEIQQEMQENTQFWLQIGQFHIYSNKIQVIPAILHPKKSRLTVFTTNSKLILQYYIHKSHVSQYSQQISS